MSWNEAAAASGSWNKESPETGTFEEGCSVLGSTGVAGFGVAGCAIVGTDISTSWSEESEV